MNKEVNFEIAKLLKKKGYNIPSLKCYLEDGSLQISSGDEGDFEEYNHNLWDNYSAPTIAEVVMWLYEKHGIWIFPDYGKKTNSWYYNIQTLAISNHPERILWESGYSSPTEAYEPAIEYTLNNLI